jgi:hypothetical protein
MERILDTWRRVSSGSIVSDYRLDYRAIGVRSPAGVKDFSSNLRVQTGSEAHATSCTMGIGGPFPGVKRGRDVTLTTQPHVVPKSIMSRSYISSPPCRVHGGSRTALLQGACSLLFDERVGSNCVCMYKVFLPKM